MKLATIANGTPDGQLALVSRHHARLLPVTDIAPTLQDALERWDTVEPLLRERDQAFRDGTASGIVPAEEATWLAPLPRAWQWLDGSAFESHGELMSKVFGMDPPSRERPLMYQGVSDTFYPATADVPFPSEDDGIDFEGEFAVITDRVAMGVTPEQATAHIRLVVQLNDWSLRKIAPVEMKTGFGWVQAKPPCSVAPVAVTPEELGEHWRDGRVALPLHVEWNGETFGDAQGGEMGFGFHELVAHAARSRALVAGTIIGSGTVSNAKFREVGSACIAERRGIELFDKGEASTPFMKFGDQVRMEAVLPDGSPLFGPIAQKVVKA
ncbi:MAG: fumarylacetoacetate hydrolase family protein [Novosphingobium lindaniclasticum]|jgi:fumarylacetoacetate (FAA) hydrolase|uniref:fumarylacetoacetate hydrolase family protein n=1 Tax=Novosphingobium lindaniclasticum TaxID=1329895 RepID=UPI002409E91B|nr:fumarylacetoacetate hydrolase family protein [Novosphingobium lindaniclasticum]MDF2640354.1 fumarylacetoacetate hydrolase family protein [Novosphingobium lindaniclasticum]